jgi:hypothetical protein
LNWDRGRGHLFGGLRFPLGEELLFQREKTLPCLLVSGLLLEDGLPNLTGLDDLALGEELSGLAKVGRVGIWRHGIAQFKENSSVLLRTSSMKVLFPQVNS